MAKQSFLPGTLDKAGKNVKTEKGWVPVKGNEHLIKPELNNGRQPEQPRSKTEKPKTAKPEKKTSETEEPVKDHEQTRKDKLKEEEKWRLVKELKNKKVELELLPSVMGKADFEFYKGNIKILEEDLKKHHNYEMDDEEATTKYRGEKVLAGDIVFIDGEARKVITIDEDGTGFTYKTKNGSGQGMIETMDARPKL